MKVFSVFAVVAVMLFSCNTVGNKTKQIINKTGEAVGEGSSEFVKGVSKGIDNTMDCAVTVAAPLAQKGISLGKYSIDRDTASDKKNMLTIYVIFNNDFTGSLSAKLFDQKGAEYGRTTVTVTAKANDARYIDFVFDKRADIESNSKIVLE